MSEPQARARIFDLPLAGVRHWWIHDERIDFRSDAYAVDGELGAVLIDPLPMEDSLLASLGPVAAICITAACHQRACWTLRERLSVPVWSPAGAKRLTERPDVEFECGAELPGGLEALKLVGPSNPHHVLLKRGDGELTVFCGDMLVPDARGGLRPVSEEHHEDTVASSAGVLRLEALAPDFLCLAHGAVYRVADRFETAEPLCG